MKHLLLILLSFVLVVSSYAQRSITRTVPTEKSEFVSTPDTRISSQLKGGGDVFWQETFNWRDETDPRGWTLPEGWSIEDLANLGAPWIWADTIFNPNGTQYNPAAVFKTPEDGFICVPARMYSELSGYALDEVSYSTTITTPAIDCSGVSSVVVNFFHTFRLCCNNTPFTLIMRVTNDNGVHWADYDLMHGTNINATLAERLRTEQINISDVAAGQPNVYIQFFFDGPMYYYWMIDDLSLSEAYDNELVLEDYWSQFHLDNETEDGHINYFPLSQYGGVAADNSIIGAYSFRGAFLNNGLSDQEDVQLNIQGLKNGQPFYEETSESTVIWPLDRDTLAISDNKLVADGYGDYQFIFNAISSNPDDVLTNNTSSVQFTITDTLMHRADFSAESTTNGGGYVAGDNSGDIVGTVYDIFETTEVDAITVYITGGPGGDLPIESTSFIVHTMKYDEELDEYIPWISSDLYTLDSTMLNTWSTLPMNKDGESEFLEPGSYVAGVEMLGESGNGMSIGWDKDTKAPDYASYLYLLTDSPHSVSNYYELSMIGFVFNETGGPVEADVTFNVDMNAHIDNGEFHPGSDFVDVAGSFNDWTGSAHLTDTDGDGIYSITISGMPVSQSIEYKYRINGNWDTSEFPNGGPNRSYTIRYWNVLNNVYNNGQTTGVPAFGLNSSLSVYPNPNFGSDISVSLSLEAAADVEITMLDIQGRVVYTKYLKNVTQHVESINNDFIDGVYFIKVYSNGLCFDVKKIILE